jgi:hypothetical protein
MQMTTACLCIVTFGLVSPAISAASEERAPSRSGASASISGSTHDAGIESKTKPNRKLQADSPTGKLRDKPAPPDLSQAVEERLRSGQMEKPVAQGEISDRLNQLYGGANSSMGNTTAEHLSR